MGAVYSHRLDKAAWLLNQELHPVMMSDLHDDLLGLARKSKLKRISGYNEMRGLSAALRSIGLSLQDFELPPDLVARPLQAHEFRVKGPDGRWWIYDETTDSAKPQIPDAIQGWTSCRSWSLCRIKGRSTQLLSISCSSTAKLCR